MCLIKKLRVTACPPSSLPCILGNLSLPAKKIQGDQCGEALLMRKEHRNVVRGCVTLAHALKSRFVSNAKQFSIALYLWHHPKEDFAKGTHQASSQILSPSVAALGGKTNSLFFTSCLADHPIDDLPQCTEVSATRRRRSPTCHNNRGGWRIGQRPWQTLRSAGRGRLKVARY